MTCFLERLANQQFDIIRDALKHTNGELPCCFKISQNRFTCNANLEFADKNAFERQRKICLMVVESYLKLGVHHDKE